MPHLRRVRVGQERTGKQLLQARSEARLPCLSDTILHCYRPSLVDLSSGDEARSGKFIHGDAAREPAVKGAGSESLA
jgi:hypothetical protein